MPSDETQHFIASELIWKRDVERTTIMPCSTTTYCGTPREAALTQSPFPKNWCLPFWRWSTVRTASGAERITLLIERKYHWPTLKEDVRACVLSCKCRRRKRTTPDAGAASSAVGGVEMDIQGMKVPSDKGNHHLLVVVDRATKFFTAFPLPS